MMFKRKEVEIRDQSHLMDAEGTSDLKPLISDVEQYLFNQGWVANSVSIFFDSMQKVWRWNCSISKLSEELTLEVGKKYKLRNELMTSPLRMANNGTNYKFEGEVVEPQYPTPSIRAWKGNGKFLTNEVDHKYDILEIVKEK